MNRAVKVIESLMFMIAVAVVVCAMICQIMQLKPVVVLSGSMEPAMQTGSLAFIDKTETRFEKGDVISFRVGDMLVSHRIIEVTEDGFKTKGDNNEDPDAGTVAASSIEGRILFSIPKLGFIIKTVMLPACIILTLLYIILKVINREKRL